MRANHTFRWSYVFLNVEGHIWIKLLWYECTLLSFKALVHLVERRHWPTRMGSDWRSIPICVKVHTRTIFKTSIPKKENQPSPTKPEEEEEATYNKRPIVTPSPDSFPISPHAYSFTFSSRKVRFTTIFRWICHTIMAFSVTRLRENSPARQPS